MEELDNNSKNFLAKVAHMRLSEEKKIAIENSLVAFVDAHPIQEGIFHNKRTAPSPFYSQLFSKFNFASAFALLLIFVGATSYAAQRALPGDTLYPIKTNINEPLVSFVSLGTKSEAITDVSHVEVRLAEAEQLSNAHRLSSSTQAKVKTAFTIAAKNVSAKITKLSAAGNVKDAQEISSQFRETLATHHDLLINLSQKKKGTDESNLLSSLAHEVDNELSSTTEVQIKIGVSVEPESTSTLQISTTTIRVKKDEPRATSTTATTTEEKKLKEKI